MSEDMKKTIGKNTIGDNGKMEVSLRTYNRSSHNQSYVWRNTQSAGTLVPFMCEIGLPGDTHEIRLESNVMTHPTVGPLFGTFKLQMDIFSCPFRLYNGWLHNNKLNIGLKMNQIKLPQIKVSLRLADNYSGTVDNQINSSCILNYLNLRGYGNVRKNDVLTERNGTALLAYLDIFKNYYANRQEPKAYYMGSGYSLNYIRLKQGVTNTDYFNTKIRRTIWIGNEITISPSNNIDKLICTIGNNIERIEFLPSEMGTQSIINGNTVFKIEKYPINEGNIVLQEIVLNGVKVVLNQFNLEDIDKLREMILYHNSATPFYLETGNSNLPNYIKYVCGGRNGSGKLLSASKQYGLLLKTYNSDIMNNWINTSWIDGVNGINSITAVSTEGGSFTIDTLTLAKKVYDMLNRVAISGGSYKDWLDTVYTDSFKETMETPTFEGGASQEVGFQEVVSNSSEVEEPLGTLAGRGTMVGSQNGGTIKIKTKEPSYIIGICSLTPRIDYSQGNRFDTLFKTLDDLHKPALDGIGFQDLITDKMAYWSTIIPNSNEMLMKTCGKQPAWLDYMTNYNRCYGEFADNYSEAFMVLNRNYKWDEDEDIEDLTTYIDPAKYNYIFADVDLSAMNFWVQIKVEMETRRLISAKSIPNL